MERRNWGNPRNTNRQPRLHQGTNGSRSRNRTDDGVRGIINRETEDGVNPLVVHSQRHGVHPWREYMLPRLHHENRNLFRTEPRRHRTDSTSSDQSHNHRSFNNDRGGNSNRGRANSRSTSQHSNPRRSGRENVDNPPNNHHRGRIGFRALESMLEKNSEDLIMELLNSKKGVYDFLKTDLTNDTKVLFLKVLSKVSDSSFNECKYKVFQIYFDDLYVDILTKYIAMIPIQDKKDRLRNKLFWDNTDEFWNNVIKICNDILDAIPTFAIKVLPKLLTGLTYYIPAFEDQHNYHVSDEIKENVKKLSDTVDILVKEHEEKEKLQVKKRLYYEYEEEPPDDFRQISVYPNSHELLVSNRGYLRKNVVKGPYKDVNHYLDVQFRLLREDFVGPLRAGITSYRSDSKQRIENVRVYKRVRFLNPETINEYYCIRLQFDTTKNTTKKKKNFSYENSKRFMFGSLLCFTMDNFKTLLFGRVSERKVEDLEKGEVIVAFDNNITILYNVDYTMIECGVYFEPYYHVLNVLKNMSVDNFPMERYIINVDPEVQRPEYLQELTSYVVDNQNFPITFRWPNRNFYQFNESQLTAFKAALTQEFAIIQGPPGTGKTYLGLKIAKTLLENRNKWYSHTPMLVICYTNHALDQFLEGILPFTDNILRVGGQSKNEKLQLYNLKNRGRFKMNPAVFHQRDEVQRILSKIKNISENLKLINFYNSVRAFDVFEDVVPNFTNTWFYSAKKNEILEWLLGGTPAASTSNQPHDPNIIAIEDQLNGININESGDENEIEEEEEDDDDDVSDSDVNVDTDDIFEVLDTMNVQCSVPLITEKALYEKIINLENSLAAIREKWNHERPTLDEFLEEEKYSLELTLEKNKYQILTAQLAAGKQRQSMKDYPTHVDLQNPHRMTHDDRWRLYFYWLNLYKEKLVEKSERLNHDFRESYKIYEEMRNIEDTNVMRNVLVVGMTTTGAARLRSTLQSLKSPIVIVEEAAEVLEAHIITSLTKHCQHLILIGDHQQLKPSTADYFIETKLDLGISLFERMVLNDIQCYTLNVQHRMRPEIANLIRPTIYPALQDHPSVTERLPILGVDNNLFFIDHTHKEADCEGTSKKNYHEVKFLICLAKHFILNGYKPEQITILAAYLGQMYEMQKERKKHKALLEHVRIAVLDNYQGEECDIILLSLVRNNDENRIGFLSIENRVCVALSRARDGLYVMGNMTQLCNASELWRKIKKTFEEENALGTELPLRCQIHRDTVTYVKSEADFLAIPEGGCDKKCETPLACGHKCTSLCHILDRDHVKYRCRMTCGRRLCEENENHLCKKMCYQECGECTYLVERRLSCNHVVKLECCVDFERYNCTVLVPTTLPCGHMADKPCHRDAVTFKCPHPCETKVEPCGHACQASCHAFQDPDHLQYKCKKPCAKYRKGCTVQIDSHRCPKYCSDDCLECTIIVRKKRTVCPHVYDVPCNSNVDEFDCLKPCTKTLSCGHRCRSQCNEPCAPCELMVEKTVPKCGHKVKTKCCEEPNWKSCNRKCPLMLPCGHPCTTRCDEPCTAVCSVMVDCNIIAPCGHRVTRIKCHLANSSVSPEQQLLYCNQPCRDELKCGHKCSGSCGECFQGRVHKRCTKECGVPLVCDHPCSFPCRQACRPCNRDCPYRCPHSVCRKKCGEVCTPCKERCNRRCEHQQCSKFCGEICDVPPCTEPCKKTLKKCGHPCIGFCGDPCPRKCLECNKEELTEIFFGFEADEDARFVVLKDCGHIFESTGLEQWLNQNEDQISFKTCPLCKTPIKTTQRYSDQIKRAMTDVANVKAMASGTPEENDTKRAELRIEIQRLTHDSRVLCRYCPKLLKVFNTLEKRLQPARRGQRQPINKHDLNAMKSKLQIAKYIIDTCCKSDIRLRDDTVEIFFPQVKFICKVLLREEDFITDQEIDDINFELNRLSRIVELSKIQKSPNFLSHYSSRDVVKRTVAQIEKILFHKGKFYEKYEEDTKVLLQELSRLVASGIGISESERREIVRAIGLSKGHWYKCPNGHPYAIGECGGAMQQSRCYECGAAIGGSHHQLLSTNAVATEMDGATYGAWSEAANMANYNLRDII